jgi:FeS assembly SUF system protein
MNDMTEDALDRTQTQTPPSPGTAEPPAAGGAAPAELQMAVVDALRGVYDPEIPVNIHELGLIYRCDVAADGNVEIDMTLTAPACPVAGEMPGVVENAVRAVPGVADVKVELVWDPPWDQSMMSEAARLELGFY